jgi:hypothetical protein
VSHSVEIDHGELQRAVLEELDRILASPFFRSASRSRQFLEYVVRKQLDGHSDLLKERTIGTEVFQRPVGYATGEDPVVRVQAGEVRRRLEQYYQSIPHEAGLRIELTVGSYAPAFHRVSGEPEAEPEPAHSHEVHEIQPVLPTHSSLHRFIPALVVVLLAAASIYGYILYRNARQSSMISQFWAPALATQQPVLICLSKPVVYRPSQEIYRRYERSHPGSFSTEVERDNLPLPLSQDEQLRWSDLYLADDFGVAVGDAYAAINLSGQLGKLGKVSQVRIGSNYSYEDLRNSPSIFVGAFNNKWTMQLTSNLHFSFVEDHEDFSIREVSPGNRIWRPRPDAQGRLQLDYAIVDRLMSSNTGQFTILAAGITGAGTQAAAELVSNGRTLEHALRNAPEGWQNHNLEMVIETTVTDSVAGPPRVVAVYWGGPGN